MKILGLVLGALLLLAVSGASAAELSGKIQTIESSERMLVLEDGTKLWIAEGIGMDTLKEGAKIKAAYEERDGKNVVTTFELE